MKAITFKRAAWVYELELRKRSLSSDLNLRQLRCPSAGFKQSILSHLLNLGEVLVTYTKGLGPQ